MAVLAGRRDRRLVHRDLPRLTSGARRPAGGLPAPESRGGGPAVRDGLDTLAELAAAHAGEPLDDLVRFLADHHPSDGHDDMAVLAIRTPAEEWTDRRP
ncbi:hypothetical protein ACWGKU_03950 [Kitasatospora sp. NPDC054768]